MKTQSSATATDLPFGQFVGPSVDLPIAVGVALSQDGLNRKLAAHVAAQKETSEERLADSGMPNFELASVEAGGLIALLDISVADAPFRRAGQGDRLSAAIRIFWSEFPPPGELTLGHRLYELRPTPPRLESGDLLRNGKVAGAYRVLPRIDREHGEVPGPAVFWLVDRRY